MNMTKPPVYDLTLGWPEGPAWMVRAAEKFADWQARGFIYMKDDMSEAADLALVREKAKWRGFAEEFDPLYFLYIASRNL